MRPLFTFLILIFLAQNLSLAQNNRLSTYEKIGWYSIFPTLKVSKKLSIHTEYQWRRQDLIVHWQQSLMRLGINYQYNPRVLFRLGYGWIETFAYGDIPLNGFGRDYTEHRLFEMVQLTHKENRMELQHRFMLEQRFVGKYNQATSPHEDQFPLLHRLRYMLRLQRPLKGTELKDRTPYVAAYDEVFIGFGPQVNANIFDQNRFGALLGYRFSKTLRSELGYLSQIIQFGRQIGGKNVFQYNNGFVFNTYINLDLTSMAKKP
jgi:hypothetical protein